MRRKIGRNDGCPCGSGKKYKHCCEGKVNWPELLALGSAKWNKYLSVRGRNILFLNKIFDALQLDHTINPRSLEQFKAAFTPEAVKKIHEALVAIWPRDLDIDSVLSRSKADVSGLYVGDYEPDLLLRGVTRHSLYANKIILVDPFPCPYIVRDEYNPIINPSKFRSQTLKNVYIWLMFAPWIESGIVEFIRTPADFDAKLNWESYIIQKNKYDNNKELKQMAEESASAKAKELADRETFRMLVLSAPDDFIRRTFRELGLGNEKYGEDDFLKYVHEMRRKDPLYLDPVDERREEYHIYTSGANYVIAKLTAILTNSYLVTDIAPRWKEIELDREDNKIALSEWSPLAKAFQGLGFKYLANIDLGHALRLRKEGRLESLRAFLRRVWSVASNTDPFGESNVRLFADELEARVREAEEEWKQIDRDLIKIIGAEMAAALLTGPQMIETGRAAFFGAAIGITGAANILYSTLKRKGFPDKHPAAFFMNLKRSDSSMPN